MTSSAAPGGAAVRAVTLTAEQAARIAAADIRPEFGAPSRVLRGPGGLDRRTVLDRGAFAADVEAALVWFPAQGSLRLAWQVLVEPPGFSQKYDVLIDAVTRELLYRHNRVLYTQGVGESCNRTGLRRSMPACRISIRPVRRRQVQAMHRAAARRSRITPLGA